MSNILVQQFRQELCCPMNISIWRHIAIAMSRRLLSESGFKRDYDDHIQQKADHQAGHSSLIVGNVYGRLMSATLGHVQSAQVAYRDISRKWHKCLGFGLFLPPRPVLNQGDKRPSNQMHRRKRTMSFEICVDKRLRSGN